MFPLTQTETMQMENVQNLVMIPHALQTASEHNSQGVYHLACQNNGAAARSFQAALTIVNEYIAAGDDATSEYMEIKDDGSSQGLAWTSLRLEGSSMCDEGFFVYSHALSFRPRPGCVSAQSDSYLASITLLFNIAQTYHRQGVKTQEQSKLRMAARFYGMCAGLAQNEEALEDAGDASTIAMIAINNQAQIHWQYLQEEEVALWLLSGLHDLVHEGEILLNPEDLDEIALNMATMPLACSKPAAAA